MASTPDRIVALVILPYIIFIAADGSSLNLHGASARIGGNPLPLRIRAHLVKGLEGAGGGPGLIFVTLAQIFGSIGGTLGAVVGTGFFLLLCFAALTSTVSLLEVPVAYVVDEMKIKRKRAVWLVAAVIFLVGIPSLLGNGYSDFFSNFITYVGADSPTDFLSFVAAIANDTLLPLGGCMIAFFAAHVWKTQNLDEELAIGAPNFKGSFVQKYLNFAIMYLAPVVLGVMFILTVLSTFFGINII